MRLDSYRKLELYKLLTYFKQPDFMEALMGTLCHEPMSYVWSDRSDSDVEDNALWSCSLLLVDLCLPYVPDSW